MAGFDDEHKRRVCTSVFRSDDENEDSVMREFKIIVKNTLGVIRLTRWESKVS
jgi:hypothetical protein